MLPLRDSHPTHKFPVFTTLIIIANVYFFFKEILSPDLEEFIVRYALVPAKINWSNYQTLTPFISSQFLHAGFVHLISNMWFLKIFADNVEERFGSIFFLFIYLFSGVVGGLAQYIFATDSTIPTLGASGAVAGVLGAYLVFFPRHKVETLVPFGFYMSVIDIPASVMLFYWFATQLFSGVGSIAIAQVGGVAWWAHIGGFVTGWIIAKLSSNTDAEEG